MALRFTHAASSGPWPGEKKTPPEATPHFEAPVHLREGYEKLREGVLSSEAFTATSGGMAVFVQQGMAAWMKVYALVVDRQPLVELSRGADELVAEGLLEEVTSLLATLLAQRKECVE